MITDFGRAICTEDVDEEFNSKLKSGGMLPKDLEALLQPAGTSSYRISPEGSLSELLLSLSLRVQGPFWGLRFKLWGSI